MAAVPPIAAIPDADKSAAISIADGLHGRRFLTVLLVVFIIPRCYIDVTAIINYYQQHFVIHNMSLDCFGCVYVLINPAMPGLVKIGHTSRDPQTRAAELSAATGVPGRFVVAWSHPVRDHEALEGLAHGRLARIIHQG